VPAGRAILAAGAVTFQAGYSTLKAALTSSSDVTCPQLFFPASWKLTPQNKVSSLPAGEREVAPVSWANKTHLKLHA